MHKTDSHIQPEEMINYGKDRERERMGWGGERGRPLERELSMIYCNLIVAHYAVDLGF